jgi:hypothetical protein
MKHSIRSQKKGENNITICRSHLYYLRVTPESPYSLAAAAAKKEGPEIIFKMTTGMIDTFRDNVKSILPFLIGNHCDCAVCTTPPRPIPQTLPLIQLNNYIHVKRFKVFFRVRINQYNHNSYIIRSKKGINFFFFFFLKMMQNLLFHLKAVKIGTHKAEM